MSKPIVLIVLDGWGIAPEGPGNAVSRAKTPNFDKLWAGYPHTKLKTHGIAVGLPEGEMGSSEVGHLMMGAGRIIFQDFSRINLAISDDSFFKNKALVSACRQAKSRQSNLHLLGLLSYGSIHADRNHLYALLSLAKKQGLKPNQVKLHIFTDGRDSPPKSALSLLAELKEVIEEIGIGEISTLSGRYFAMDRDKRWERTKKAYEALVLGKGVKANSPEGAIEQSYEKNVTDEFILPTILSDDYIKDGDAVIFYNFRTDRERQLTRAFVESDFYSFERERKLEVFFVTMTEFEKGLSVSAIAFHPKRISSSLARILSEKNLRQLHLAETEKYTFVTYYFNGLHNEPVVGEDRIQVSSPKVATYDLKPEMSSYEITDILLKKIKLKIYDFILVNYANPDIVGHTGILKAGIKACEAVDICLGKVVRLVLAFNGVCIITADHGNVEEMINLQTGEISTKHSLNLVPLIIVGKQWQGKSKTLPTGTLADVTPTILKIMNIPKLNEMTGKSLI